MNGNKNLRGKIWLGVIVIPCMALLTLLSWAVIKSDGNPGGVKINSDLGEIAVVSEMAPPLVLDLIDGGVVKLDDLKGKVIMVDFWSSWCPPCLEEAPILSSVYTDYAGKDVEFIGIAIWDQPNPVISHINEFQIKFPVGLDREGKIAINYGLRGIPEKYFIDQKGNLARKFSGQISSDKLKEIIDGMLSEAS